MNIDPHSPFAAIELYRPRPAAPAPVAAPAPTRKATAGPKREGALRAGDKVGEWTLVAYVPGVKRRDPVSGALRRIEEARWHCRCSCGVARSVQAHNISSRSSNSCGHTSAYGRGRGVPQ